MSGKVTKACIEHARKMIRLDVTGMGDFICHLTAYDSEMEDRPKADHRQCKGATAHFKKCLLDRSKSS